MLVIGLVGGVASGKSFVAECFARQGAEILDADKIGHEILERPEVIAEIQSIWPTVIVQNGSIDRRSLGDIVFRSESHEQQLQKLETITHPLIGRRIDQRMAELRSQQSVAVVLDAPVLIKAGWHHRCDKIVVVEASQTQRLQRTAARGWTADQLSLREQSQTPLPQKRRMATDIVNNSNSKQETCDQIKSLWAQWGLAKETADRPPSDFPKTNCSN
jgi:dephospho-CoA kinase